MKMAKTQMNKIKFNQNIGITLIALVITIIILLILAGVAIASLTGENGLLNRAVGAKDATEKAEILDNVRVKILGKMVEKNGQDLTEEEIKDILDDYFDATEVASIDLSDDDAELTLNNGNKVTIGELLKDVSIAGGGAGGKTEIKVGGTALNVSSTTGTAEALKSSYGQDTDYTSNNGNNWTWQLFYDDATNIYLIAKNYVPGNTLPSELLTDGQYTSYCRYFATSISDTTSPIPAGDIWKEASSATTVQGNSYLKWVGSSVDNKNNKYINMKAVAYMMDTSKWSSFAGSATGATAIGGPTLEMFALSYNAKHSTNQLGTYGTIIDASTDSTNGNANQHGYKVKIGTGSWSNSISGLDTTTTDTDGNMWVRTNYTNAYGYWMASPSSYDYYSYDVSYVNYNGNLNSSYVNGTNFGFRPLVSIPKSSIK